MIEARRCKALLLLEQTEKRTQAIRKKLCTSKLTFGDTAICKWEAAAVRENMNALTELLNQIDTLKQHAINDSEAKHEE
jgi:uncharacterized protein YacL (UPF0231 family)